MKLKGLEKYKYPQSASSHLFKKIKGVPAYSSTETGDLPILPQTICLIQH